MWAGSDRRKVRGRATEERWVRSADEVQELVDALGRGHGGCLVLEASPPPLVEVPDAPVRVIRHRASIDEQLLAFAGLTGMTEPLLDDLARLPPVQAGALAGALALGPPTGDVLAVAAGFRSLLHVAADRGPVLLVVEHAHLLDRGSASVLGFAARRLGDAPVGVVVTQDPASIGRLELLGARRCHVEGGGQRVRTPAPAAGALRQALGRAEERGSAADLAAALETSAGGGCARDRPGSLARAARAWLEAGDVDRALEVGLAARQIATSPLDVAHAELLLGRVRFVLGEGRASAEHLRTASEEAPRDAPEVATEALLLLAAPDIFGGRLESASAALGAAQRRIEEADLPASHPLRALHAAATAALELATGGSVEPTALESVASLVAEHGEPLDLSLVATTVALPLIWIEQYESAASMLGDLVASLRSRGALGALPLPLCALSVVERRAGRPTRSLLLASEARDLAEQVGHRAAWRFAQSELANGHSLFGDVERCRTAAHAVLESGTGGGAYRTSALSALATVELWTGNPLAVIDLLEPVANDADPLAQAVTLYLPTLLTAYVEVARQEDAERLLERLRPACTPTAGRTAAVVSRCEALLAPPEERDAAFAAAIDRAAGQPLTQALTRLLHARRLVADGEVPAGATLLRDLAALGDENLLGVARAARLTLARLGMAVDDLRPAWSFLGRAELEVALAAADGTSAHALADRLGLSPPEVLRLRDGVTAMVGAHREIRLLGGLAVLEDGRPLDLPLGAAATTVALLALRRAVHIEELTEVLWPEVAPAVARRRLRNVLTRVRQAVGPLLVRCGDRIELADDVVVDHHVLEASVRRTLAQPPGPERTEALSDLLARHRAPLLPEASYDEWAQPARRQSEARLDALIDALAEEAGRSS